MRTILAQHPDIIHHYLKIAEGCIFEQPTAVSTILGSCVSVTFFCPRRCIGAIFHALLPTISRFEKDPDAANRYRYVDSSIRHIFTLMKAKNIPPADLQIKLFGGAGVLLEGELSSGRANVEVALQTLAELNLKVIASDVGGTKGRRLVFFTHTGEVYIRRHRDPAEKAAS